jgi:hypothetical protein
MVKKQSLEEQINHFLQTWRCKEQIAFLRDIIPLFELYDVDDENDWLEKAVGGDEENVRTVRLIRTVYLISRIAEFHAGTLCMLKVQFKNLWQKMEKMELDELSGNS